MNIVLIHRSAVSRFGLVLAAVCLCAGVAAAQGSGGPPGIDHYKVYRVDPPPTGAFPVFTRDQFMLRNHIANFMPFFATPVMKDGVALFDPILHYDWWRIDPAPFRATVFATNQFGSDQELHLKQAEYLLLPSVKFPQPGQAVPVANHYKCYSVDGLSPARLVVLQDQFGFNQAFVDSARFFCTPVEKEDATGFYPIVRPEAHLVCYDITKTPPTQPRPIVVQDQFGFWQTVVALDEMLCVPTFKTGVVSSEGKTWGELKAIYR